MYNEIRRKITSLTLMTIMLAGGMTFAAPGMMPEVYAANANLFVSAENSQFDNYMSGPQVIEVVVIDSDINDTDEAKGEPDVTVNGKDLRMAQSSDGNWYGYFADKKQALIADSTVDDATARGQGLDFGGFCDNSLVLTGDTNLAATGSMTLTGVTTADVLTLNSLTYTAVAGAAGGDTEFSIDGDDDADATALAAAISSQDGDLTATATGAVVTVVVDTAGLAGNTIANSGPDSFTFEDPTLTGGLDDIDSFGTITIPAEISIGNILTIGGEAFEATSGDAGANVYDVDGTGAGVDTALLAAAINDDSSLVDAVVDDDNTITLTAKTGTSAAAGDAITTVVTVDVTVVANQATLSGGTDLTAAEGDITLDDVQSVPVITINGLTFTAVDGGSGATTFQVDVSDQAAALDLASTITADARTGTTVAAVDVVAVAVGNIVTITATPSGTAGNGVNLIGDTGILASGPTLLGGTDDGAKAQTLDFADSDGVFIQSTTGTGNAASIAPEGNADGTAPTAACGEISNGDGTDPGMNVVREAKKPNSGSTLVSVGQIGVDSEQWPFIQLYTLNPTGNVEIQYNKGGGAQSTTLTFDTVDQFANAELDNTKYTTEAEIHATITDLWLNIDPTDEDSWTFGTVGTISTNYQVFDENGAQAGDLTTAGVIDISNTLGDLMCENNCVLKVDANAQNAEFDVLTLQDNDDSAIVDTTLSVTSTFTDDDTDGLNSGAEIADPTGSDGALFIDGTVLITEDAAGDAVTATFTDDGSDGFTSGAELSGFVDAAVGGAAAFDDGAITITQSATGQNPASFETAGGNLANEVPVTITEQGPNSGVFGTYDESDTSVLAITNNAKRGTSASLDYNETPVTILVGFEFATIDIQPFDDEWNSGEEIPLVIVDGDANKNSRVDEDLDLFNPEVPLIPTIATGDPFTLGEAGVGSSDTKAKAVYTSDAIVADLTTDGDSVDATVVVDKFSERAIIAPDEADTTVASNLVIDLRTTVGELKKSIQDTTDSNFEGFNFLNIDVRSLDADGPFDVFLLVSTADDVNIIGTDGNKLVTATPILLVTGVDAQSFTQIEDTANDAIFALDDDLNIGIAFEDTTPADVNPSGKDPVVADFFTFGFINDGLVSGERIANQIIRIEVEETGDNTSTFEGSLEYKMINQLNILDVNTYADLSTIADDPNFIVIEDLTDEDSPRVNYLDLGSDGVSTQVSDQQEAPSHSGIVSFDSDSYKTADTVTITLEDLDLNVDSDLVDIYTVVDSDSTVASGKLADVVGDDAITHVFASGDPLGELLDIQFDDKRWTTPALDTCTTDGKSTTNSDSLEDFVDDTGLAATGFTLVETGKDTGVFTGDFQIPGSYCPKAGVDTTNPGKTESVTGLDIEVNYVDFRDASGEVIKVSDSAGVRANTGSISLDRTVYPVPFGVPDNFGGAGTTTSPDGRALFPIHQTGMNFDGSDREPAGLQSGEYIDAGDLSIHVRVNDPDFDLSASGEDSINTNSTDGVGPVKISVIRGSDEVVLGFAGGPEFLTGHIDTNGDDLGEVRQFGPMDEIAPDAGIFEIDVVLRYTDGPASETCSSETEKWIALDGSGLTEELNRFDVEADDGDHCILQGDILQVEYTDPTDASGSENTVTDSATFDLRNGVLQSDKSVYIIGSDMILTLIEPDFDLDNDQAETYDLDLIEWDSDAATISMGDANGEQDAFDPEPFNFRETGDSTGIFQIVVEIPEELDDDRLERGEEAVLEYTDWGPSGSDYVGDEDEDVNLTIFTSNFGATVELDQKVYSWTDKVYITIVAPDHNFDGDLVDEIGDTDDDPIKVSSRGFDLDNYKLVETGTDTGIFTGEVILTGFDHDADGQGGDTEAGFDTNPRTSPSGSGPTDGFLQTDDDDGLTISFEFSEDETVVGSSLIRWNIGEVQWLEASYPASGTGVVRVIDPDMNLDPEAVDNFDTDVWSDSDAGGIDLTVTETNEATGIFEGTVFFTVSDESSGHRLRVAEGDTVTAEYEDNTLPDPYTTADELDITATSLIGTVVPPLERAPAANLRTVDAFGNSLDTVSVDQQVQVSADLVNGQDREQTFAYLVQIQDGNGVTVSLAWITGQLSAGQSFSPALSWIPEGVGSYTATAFVWESVDNPTALSPPVSTQITVQ